MPTKSSKWELSFVHYIPKFTILRFAISRFEYFGSRDRHQRRVLVRNYILNPFFYRSYDWNYNLNRHLKYECGKENAFQCAKCGRKFPHKQNCVYHLKRKHKIVCDTIDQYMAQGLVVFRGGQGAGGQQVANPE